MLPLLLLLPETVSGAFVVACNGYADMRPVEVGVRPVAAAAPAAATAAADEESGAATAVADEESGVADDDNVGSSEADVTPVHGGRQRGRRRGEERPSAELQLRPDVARREYLAKQEAARRANRALRGKPLNSYGRRTSSGTVGSQNINAAVASAGPSGADGPADGPASGPPSEPDSEPGPSDGARWTHSLSYGACEEYTDVDIMKDQIFFVLPDDTTSCALRPEVALESSDVDLGEVAGVTPEARAKAARLAVLLTQPNASAETCVVQARNLATHWKAGAGAELAALDAFTPPKDPEEITEKLNEAQEVELAIRGQNSTDGDIDLSPPLEDSEAVIRLEDKIEPDTLFTEVIGSRTLGLGQVYHVEPKELHVILEDLRGAHVYGRRDIAFKKGNTYIGIRLGRGDDPAYPQQLALYPCEEKAPKDVEDSTL